MAASVPVGGSCDPTFDLVAARFAEGWEERGEAGAALCVIVEGRPVVDMWGGWRDAERREPWASDTLVLLLSAIKGVVATSVLQEIERGALALDDTVASYWPEFGASGKDAVTVRHVLTHQAGLPAIRERLPIGSAFDWHAMCAALANEPPWWEPGTRHGYHVVTFGWLAGELLRRATGRSVRDAVAAMLAPIDVELSIGVGTERDARVAWMHPTLPAPGAPFNPFEQDGVDANMLTLAFTNPPDLADPDVVNSTDFRRAMIPASNGFGNARSLARFYSALVHSELISTRLLDEATGEHVAGVDAVLGMRDRFGLGYMLPCEMRDYSPNPTAFGHPGAGGQLGFADPQHRMAFGYTVNQPFATGLGGDHRWRPLVDAVYECL